MGLPGRAGLGNAALERPCVHQGLMRATPSSHGETEKVFLYTYMRDQPIWQSLRFWNAAFFDAVQCERSRRPMPTNTDGNETVTDDKQFQENITFGQLGTFACNMRSFGLSKELCLEFLRKQSTIANLRKDQVKLLRDNIERFKEN
ncbi:protein IWS1 isoform X2 [Biomphalaria pfeifferi]|uniref:Protein IWS1 isoform X2 n=1 Tax=Biomphalaria pfeifferi TaxID=112525 RepID=A0AAD8BVL2_BIOPF|nr:protein IWS1 isoform X2 [Biomphalaria pfeifferi]